MDNKYNFKVGDTIRWIDPKQLGGDWQNSVILGIYDTFYEVKDAISGTGDFSKDWDLELVEPNTEEVVNHINSPIQEKTIKEIVFGVYGRVAVTNHYPDEHKVTIQLTDTFGEYKQYEGAMILKANELEAASVIFLELAKFLREDSNGN